MATPGDDLPSREWIAASLQLSDRRVAAMGCYERMCAAGTLAHSADQWRWVAIDLAVIGGVMPCASMARQMFDRASDAQLRAQRVDTATTNGGAL